MKPTATPIYTMPATVCAVCDARFDDPAGYIDHLSTCNPVRVQQIGKALRGLRDASPYHSLEVSR